MRLKDIAETFKKDLQDAEFVQGYLQDALDDGIPSFLLALGDVVRANQGMGKLAEDTALASLSENGNPQFTTVDRVLRSLGMQFSIALHDRRTP